MTEKKEIQEILIKNINERVSEDELLSVLKTIAPGTNLRTALDGTLNAGKGALIVIENEYLHPILDGGFRINTRFTPQKLIELTKMDGAIIISDDLKRINFANVLLTPDSKIKSAETGTRHKAAERTAKQAKTIAIAISERRNEITVFYKNTRHHLQSTANLLRKANEQVQLLEKQKELFDNYVERLNKAEIQSHSNLSLATAVIQKGMLIQKLTNELRKYNVELGKEGAILKIRLKEIISGVEKETDLVIKDYTNLDFKKSKVLLDSLSYDELTQEENILSALVYEEKTRSSPIKGWRVLSKTCLLEPEIALVVSSFKKIDNIFGKKEDDFKFILDDDKAKRFNTDLEKLRISS